MPMLCLLQPSTINQQAMGSQHSAGILHSLDSVDSRHLFSFVMLFFPVEIQQGLKILLQNSPIQGMDHLD